MHVAFLPLHRIDAAGSWAPVRLLLWSLSIHSHALLFFPKTGSRPWPAATRALHFTPKLCWTQRSHPTPTGAEASRGGRRSVWHGSGGILSQKPVNQGCSGMLLPPGPRQVPPCFPWCLGWTRSVRTASQAMTELDLGSNCSTLCSFLGQTSRLHLLLLSLMPCPHGSLSHPPSLQLQPLSCITLTPTAPSVGHPGAALGTGTPLHP